MVAPASSAGWAVSESRNVATRARRPPATGAARSNGLASMSPQTLAPGTDAAPGSTSLRAVMTLGARRAAPAAVLVACALAAPAAHAADVAEVLVGDIAQVQESDLPGLSKDPPVQLRASIAPTPTESAAPGKRLPRTGPDSALAARAGLGLLGAGLGLRRLTADGAPD